MRRSILIIFLSILTILSLIGCSSSEQTSKPKVTSPNPKLEANLSNDVRVELPDLKQVQLGTQDELELFSNFITSLKYEDIETIIVNAYPTKLRKNKELTTEESLELFMMVKDIKPIVLTKLDSTDQKGGWCIYIRAREYGVQIGHTGDLITCFFDDKAECYIFSDQKGEFYNQINDFVHKKQKS